MALDTDWQIIPTAHPGVRPQGLMDPVRSFRVRRINHTVLVDLAGLPLVEGAGLARIGILPDWAAAAIPDRYHWVNDHPTSLHASQCAVYRGTTIYWTGQIVKGELTDGRTVDGKLAVNRPDALHGGFEHTTVAPFPHHLLEEAH